MATRPPHKDGSNKDASSRSPLTIPKRAPGEPPALVLGAMNFGKRTPEAESTRIVRRALERGVRSFDTANVYNAGESERILGRALGAERDAVVVATKAGLGPAANPGEGRTRFEGLSPQALGRALDGSLERLGTSRVDLYYLHAPDRTTPIEATLGALATFTAEGRIGGFGVSNYSAWEIADINAAADRIGLARPVVSQVLYNVLHRELEIEYFAFARAHPVHTTTYNALAGGLLSGRHTHEAGPEKGSRFDGNAVYQRRYWTPAMFDRVDALRAVAESEGCSLVELAYAWLASRPDVDSILIGPATVDQLDAALDAAQRVLSPATLTQLEDLGRAFSGTDTHYAR